MAGKCMPLEALSRRIHEVPPLQLPGRPTRLRHFYIGGPEDAADRRMVISAEALEHLLAVARSSEVQTAVLNQVGLEVSVWEDPSGHRYEQITLRSLEPEPKKVPLSFGF